MVVWSKLPANLALTAVGTVYANTLTTLFVDGVNQGDGVCIRMANDAISAAAPLKPSSMDIVCGM